MKPWVERVPGFLGESVNLDSSLLLPDGATGFLKTETKADG